MNNIELEIIKKLEVTELQHNIKIPYAIESGSRSWKFASPDSDYDCRFMYVREKDFYISVFDKKDFISYEPDEIYDINGWDLKKVISHIVKSNVVMSEWLSSNDIYLIEENFHASLKKLATDFYNPISASYHYLSIARNKLDEVICSDDAKIKKYFYILRPLANLRYINTYGVHPPMEYYKTVEKIDITAEIKNEINNLLEIKKDVRESFLYPKNEILIKYFEEEISYYTKYLKTQTFTKNRDYESADKVFKDLIEMVWKNE